MPLRVIRCGGPDALNAVDHPPAFAGAERLQLRSYLLVGDDCAALFVDPLVTRLQLLVASGLAGWDSLPSVHRSFAIGWQWCGRQRTAVVFALVGQGILRHGLPFQHLEDAQLEFRGNEGGSICRWIRPSLQGEIR